MRQALQVLKNLQHRGACGCEVNTGDGAGILIQTPDAFLRKVAPAPLPPAGEYGVGLVFLPQAAEDRAAVEELFARIIAEEGQQLLGWRDVPTDDSPIGPSAVRVEPVFRQVFIGAATTRSAPASTTDERARRSSGGCTSSASASSTRSTRSSIADDQRKFFYIVNLSCNTLIYKGMLTASQIETMFPDLREPDLPVGAGAGAPALQHQHVPVVAAGAPVSATSRTTARSTRSPATSTGCARARGCSSRASSATS